MRLQKKTGKSMSVFTRMLSSLILVFVASTALAQVDVTATVDRNVLSPDETLTYTVSVSSAGDYAIGEPELPQLGDFELLNEWTSRETRASFVTTPQGPKFQTVRTTRFNYMLQPKREGKLALGSSQVVIDGKTFYTKPISIEVAAGAYSQPSNQGYGQQPGQPPAGVHPPPGFLDEEEEDLFSQLLQRRGLVPPGGTRTLPSNPQDAFFIQVEADKNEAYVGEQITVSWYLYTRGHIRDFDTLKYPSLRGFWKEDIEIATHLNYTQEVVNGIPYKKALLASFALFPIKEGTATIDSYTAKCAVIPGYDAFSGFGYGKAYTYTKSSQPVKVKVKPIPLEGRPDDFSGAVGDFQVTARVDDNQVIEGQPFSYKIRFEGKGNAKLIDIPPFQPPEGLELYETEKDAKFFRTGTSYKDFNILLIPRRAGEFTIPSISVSIFDPNLKRYVTRTTEPVTVHAQKSQGGPGSEKSLHMAGGEKTPERAYEPSLQLVWNRGMLLTSSQTSMGLSGLFGFVLLALLWRARSELGWGQKKKDLLRQLRARLRRVDQRIAKGDWRGVGTDMTNTVYFVLGAISGEGGANVELEKLLAKAPPSIRRELAEPLTKQMETFQILSFAQEEVVGALKEPAHLKKAVSEMAKLMERAVALGLSAGQSDESETGPRAS